MSSVAFGCKWEDGEWSIKELDAVMDGVHDLAREMGGPSQFRAKIGGTVYISQENIDSPGKTYSPTWHVVKFWTDLKSFDHWTVVHELGHVWDGQNNRRLSKYLEAYTGGFTLNPQDVDAPAYCSLDPHHEFPGCNKAGYYYGGTPPKTSGDSFDRGEDFAESVVAYVYPNEAHAEVMKQLARYKREFNSRPDIYRLYESFLYYDDFRVTERGQYIANLLGK